MSPEDAKLFLERDMTSVEQVAFCSGTAAVFSTRSPAKETCNEDAAALVPFDGETGVILVADGAGGLRGGAQASSTTIYEMCASLEQLHGTGAALREAILTGIENANREVNTLAIGAATTIAVVELRGDRLRPYHVGDSEILVIGQRGRLKLQTVSHSPMGYAVEIGLLNEDEAMRHEDRHFVFNVVGTPEMRIEVGPDIELAPRDTVVVACDGLFDNIPTAEVVEVMRTGSLLESTQRLVDRCQEQMRMGFSDRPSKPDDLTLITYRLED